MISKGPTRQAATGQAGGVEAALQRAASAIQSGNITEAERAAFEVLKTHPGDARAAHIYGRALHAQGRGQDAIAPLERAAQQSRNPILETQLGMLLRGAERPSDALKVFERAIRRQPPFPPAFLEYGSLLLALFRYDEAIGVLERGLALAPNFAEILVHLGTAYAARGERDRAAAMFSRAIANAPGDPDTMFIIATLMKNSHCFGQASGLFKRLVDINPKDNAARISLGVCLLELGETAAALDQLRAASSASTKAFGDVLGAAASAGNGRFWLSRSAAKRAFGE
jgi:tetratricopeptide (TPR) repeat protein